MRCSDCDYVRKPGEAGPYGDIGRCPGCGSYYYLQARQRPPRPEPKARSPSRWLWLVAAIVLAVVVNGLLFGVADRKSVGRSTDSSAATEGAAIFIPSDAKATYTVIGVYSVDRSHAKIEVARDGTSGRTYSSRIVNCDNWTYVLVGSGDSQDEMRIELSAGKEQSVLAGSVAYYIAKYACSHSQIRQQL